MLTITPYFILFVKFEIEHLRFLVIMVIGHQFISQKWYFTLLKSTKNDYSRVWRFNHYSAGTVFRRQNMTYLDVRF